MKLSKIFSGTVAVLLAFTVSMQAHAQSADDKGYKTLPRVEFVLDCAQEHAAKMSRQEAFYKCSCAMDRIVEEMSFEEFVELSTISNAITIAGERGGYIRDARDARPKANRYRDALAKARKGCFLPG